MKTINRCDFCGLKQGAMWCLKVDGYSHFACLQCRAIINERAAEAGVVNT